MRKQKHFLVAPLNWGLGHATRCIPIIRYLLALGHRVTIGSDGRALRLLQQEFPELSFLELPSYGVRYPYKSMLLNIGLQFPRLLKAIQLERQFLNKILKTQHFDAIISDNRYGLTAPKIPAVFITHQLNIKVEQAFLQATVNYLNRKLLAKFDACWVPDVSGKVNLSGELAHPSPLDNTEYLGVLSRLKPKSYPKKRQIIAMLSGPEPQRSYLEKELIQQIKVLDLTALIVGGKTDVEERFMLSPKIEYISYLNSAALNKALLESETVICRSGYSSLMDLVQINCPQAILIPTPGQTEQEYLAKNMHKNSIFPFEIQGKIELSNAIERLQQYKGAKSFINNKALETTITQFIDHYLP